MVIDTKGRGIVETMMASAVVGASVQEVGQESAAIGGEDLARGRSRDLEISMSPQSGGEKIGPEAEIAT